MPFMDIVSLSIPVHASVYRNISETTVPIQLNFHMETPYDPGTKFVQIILVTWPRLPPQPLKIKPSHKR